MRDVKEKKGMEPSEHEFGRQWEAGSQHSFVEVGEEDGSSGKGKLEGKEQGAVCSSAGAAGKA